MANEGTLDDIYFEWLYRNFVGSVTNRNPNSSYWGLTKQLYKTRYSWLIHDDKHRGEDGKELRRDFINGCDIEDVEVNWFQDHCSVLEMLIGLSCRAASDTNEEPGDWLWKLLANLGLQSYSDRVYSPTVAEEVEAIVQRFLSRTYDTNGVGGLFPLNNARQDQTQIKIWYQLQAYLLEGEALKSVS